MKRRKREKEREYKYGNRRKAGEGRGSLSSLGGRESHEFRGLLPPSRTKSNVEAKHRKCQNNRVLCGGSHNDGHVHCGGHCRFASSFIHLIDDCIMRRDRKPTHRQDCYFFTTSSNPATSEGPFNAEIKIVKVQHIIAWSPSSSSSRPHQSHLSLSCASRRLVGKSPSALCSHINDGIESSLTPLSFTFKLVPIFTLIREALSRTWVGIALDYDKSAKVIRPKQDTLTVRFAILVTAAGFIKDITIAFKFRAFLRFLWPIVLDRSSELLNKKG